MDVITIFVRWWLSIGLRKGRSSIKLVINGYHVTKRSFYFVKNGAKGYIKAMKMKVGVSGCLLGRACNFNGKDLLSSFVQELQNLAPIEFVPFCPEDFSFGTPRANLRIVGGDGYDVLEGRARVINEHGDDVTGEQLKGAKKFLTLLQSSQIEHAILMEGSPSCGSNVLLNDRDWPRGGFKRGVGVACALLRKNGVKVFSSFDEKTISDFISSIFPNGSVGENLLDLKDRPQFKALF